MLKRKSSQMRRGSAFNWVRCSNKHVCESFVGGSCSYLSMCTNTTDVRVWCIKADRGNKIIRSRKSAAKLLWSSQCLRGCRYGRRWPDPLSLCGGCIRQANILFGLLGNLFEAGDELCQQRMSVKTNEERLLRQLTFFPMIKKKVF